MKNYIKGFLLYLLQEKAPAKPIDKQQAVKEIVELLENIDTLCTLYGISKEELAQAQKKHLENKRKLH